MGFFFFSFKSIKKLYSTRWSPQIFANYSSFSYLCSSGLRRIKTSMSHHVLLLFCHFTSDRDFSSPMAIFSPGKFLDICESVSVSSQLFLKVNGVTNNSNKKILHEASAFISLKNVVSMTSHQFWATYSM